MAVAAVGEDCTYMYTELQTHERAYVISYYFEHQISHRIVLVVSRAHI
jgi:hypothetical protein